MEHDITCPFCEHEFTAMEWDDGECPKCGEKFYWYETVAEDFSDTWSHVGWDTLDKRLMKSMKEGEK